MAEEVVGNAMVVSLHYTLKDDEGVIIDSCDEHEPLVYLHGAGNIIEGLEDAIEGSAIGAAFEVSISPENGYGALQPHLVQTMERAKFPEEAELDLGSVFVVNGQDGDRHITVTKIDGDMITVDGNHELAGKTLHFTGKITDVRAGTPEELQHGHPHSPGGCGH